MLELVVGGWVMPVRRALILGEAGVLRPRSFLLPHHVVEVEVGEDAVVGNAVVRGGWLEVMQVGEAGAIGSTEAQRHVLVTIVDSVAVLAREEAEDVVLNDRVLMDRTGVGTGGLTADAITDGKDILKTVVL